MSSTISPTMTPSVLPTPSASETPAPQQGTGPSSPLLFFVALGFGVVFTNLWIIVGVKYCFRYNQRNRARLAGEDPDAVDLNAMPRQRRRREKKLMTIDEVNEKFPLVKYKTWRSTRADQGLSTSGGITNAPVRPASVKDQPHSSKKEVEIHENEPKTPTTIVNEKVPVIYHGPPEQITETVGTSSADTNPPNTALSVPEPALLRASTYEDDNGADHIQTAIPTEQLPDPGDTCAICIDTIEDDDDVRGLICGHAFHASCVDPWLTSRRACCPLCKADYYVPKPRPEGTPEEGRRIGRPDHDAVGPGSRRTRTGSFLLAGVFHSSQTPLTSRRSRLSSRTQLEGGPTAPNPETPAIEQTQPTWRSRLPAIQLPALSRIRRNRGNMTGEQPSDDANATPAQLEAGRT